MQYLSYFISPGEVLRNVIEHLGEIYAVDDDGGAATGDLGEQSPGCVDVVYLRDILCDLVSLHNAPRILLMNLPVD